MLVEDRGDRGGVAFAGRGEQRRQRCRREALLSSDARVERDPALVPVFARERVLHVAQRGRFRCAGVRAHADVRAPPIAVAQRFQPALGFFPEIVEGGHETLPSVECLASAYFRPEEGSS